jgi:KamA family protein
MMKYTPFTLNNFKSIPQVGRLSEEQIQSIEVVGSVLPFRVNNYVTDELVDWDNVGNDPMFKIAFPQKDMLLPDDYAKMKAVIDSGADKKTVRQAANEIRLRLNPHPAGQLEHNVPVENGKKYEGIQHKYRETALFFPSQGQMCHAFCTFCFRWPQFTGMDEFKMSAREANLLSEYVTNHTELTGILFTGGDPLVMKTKVLADYIEPLLEIPHIRTIRIGTRALTWWPYRFVTDDDAGELLELFRKIRRAGKHVAFMAHFNHPAELKTDIVKEAINRIQETGTIIRTQSPMLRHINDSPESWIELWRKQVDLNCIPYYTFIARDTGAQHYFAVPLGEAWEIFREAYSSVSGICRSVRGPSMSCLPGKVQILGVTEVRGEKVFVMRMIQGRSPDWVDKPFFAEFDEKATWYTDLKPAFGEEKFFFQDELTQMLQPDEDDVPLE